MTAAVTAASAAAAMWRGLRLSLYLVSSERVGECGAVMVSGVSGGDLLTTEAETSVWTLATLITAADGGPVGVPVGNDRQRSGGSPAGLVAPNSDGPAWRLGTAR